MSTRFYAKNAKFDTVKVDAANANSSNKVVGDGTKGSGLADEVELTAASIMMKKPIASAILATAVGALLINFSLPDAINFAGVVALSTSLSDAIMSATGEEALLNSYLSSTESTYINLSSLVGAGASMGVLGYLQGYNTEALLKLMACTAIGAGIGPKIVTVIFQDLVRPSPPTKNPPIAKAGYKTAFGR